MDAKAGLINKIGLMLFGSVFPFKGEYGSMAWLFPYELGRDLQGLSSRMGAAIATLGADL